MKTPFLALFLAAIAVCASGCATSPKNNSIPWARPAGFENQIPGMDTGGFGR